MWGNGPGHLFEVFGALAWGFVGFILFLLWLGVILLLVRFLLIGTRAAKHYLRSNGQYDGVLPQAQPKPAPPAAPTAPAAPTTTTRTPRTPKAPPA